MPTQPPYRGRFAPSPTGPLHFGSLVAALGSWLYARRAGGEWLVRIEDLDPPREVPGAAGRQLATLAAFGLAPDQAPWFQSTRGEAYAAALDALMASGDAFECHCSRSELNGSETARAIAVPALGPMPMVPVVSVRRLPREHDAAQSPGPLRSWHRPTSHPASLLLI